MRHWPGSGRGTSRCGLAPPSVVQSYAHEASAQPQASRRLNSAASPPPAPSDVPTSPARRLPSHACHTLAVCSAQVQRRRLLAGQRPRRAHATATQSPRRRRAAAVPPPPCRRPIVTNTRALAIPTQPPRRPCVRRCTRHAGDTLPLPTSCARSGFCRVRGCASVSVSLPAGARACDDRAA